MLRESYIIIHELFARVLHDNVKYWYFFVRRLRGPSFRPQNEDRLKMWVSGLLIEMQKNVKVGSLGNNDEHL